MTCPYLEYRREDGEHDFDHERPYCAVSDSFVSPMRADVCNDRHGFAHASDCEIYPGDLAELDAEVLEEAPDEEAVTADPTD